MARSLRIAIRNSQKRGANWHMFEKTSSRHTIEFPVSLTLMGQEPVDAVVHLKIGERLSDLLNDARAFIPVRRADGAVMMAAKSTIVSVLEKLPEAPSAEAAEQAARERAFDEEFRANEERVREKSSEQTTAFRPRRHFDPYETLRVSRDARVEEIRRAYKERMKHVHPDVIAALDLDPDLERAANLTAQKVNHAYQMIMRERKAAEGGATA